MLTTTFRSLLEEYHRKKWFPDLYPEPFGEFVDYVSNGMIDDLVEASKREKRASYLPVAHYIAQLLPEIQYREIYSDYRNALLDPLSEEVTSGAVFYAIRNSSEETAAGLWRELQGWSRKWESAMLEWAQTMRNVESQHKELRTAYAEKLRLPVADETELRNSRDLFAWELQTRTKARNYKELLRYFQLEHWSNAADWNALSSLAKSVAETCSIPHLPNLKIAENSAIQFLFPILPPKRLLLEYGTAKSPFDAMRFLIELGKGFFYQGMNPENAAEERICGDPSLPWFWGYLFSSLLVDPEGIKSFIGLNAESMQQDTRPVLQSWYRRELMLAIYRTRASDFNQLQDQYTSLWELAYPVEPPVFLSLYEYCLSTESAFRRWALLSSQNMIKHLQSKYGRRWFANRKWTKRAREYWWEGFKMTTAEVLSDQQVPESTDYPF
jgi:hypothetical protein